MNGYWVPWHPLMLLKVLYGISVRCLGKRRVNSELSRFIAEKRAAGPREDLAWNALIAQCRAEGIDFTDCR